MQHFVYFEIFEADPHFSSSRECGNSVPTNVYEECKRRWPQFFQRGRHSMHVKAPVGDRILEEVYSFLRTHGREPHLQRFPAAPYQHPVLYQVRGERVFGAEDLALAEYFSIFPRKQIGFGGRQLGTNLFEIQRSRISKQPIGMPASCFAAICTDELRNELEAQMFIGLSFREVLITGRGGPISPLWQLWSELLMPPLLNRVIDEAGNDYDSKNMRGCRVDDFYVPIVYRFPEADVQRMEPFDAALTCEHFGTTPGRYLNESHLNLLQPEIILSRRVREWCEKRKLKIDWYPIVIE